MRKNKILILALLVCLSIPVRAQNTDNNIIGIVVDKSGNPVYGASVNVEGGAVETRVETDKDGKFEIAVEKGQRLSVFSVDKGSTTVVVKADGPMTIVMGYAAQTIDVGANRTFNRQLFLPPIMKSLISGLPGIYPILYMDMDWVLLLCRMQLVQV